MTIRVSREAEIEGIDMPEFGALCYPDFVLASGEHASAVATSVDETAATRSTWRFPS